jgi:hypothetical protein
VSPHGAERARSRPRTQCTGQGRRRLRASGGPRGRALWAGSFPAPVPAPPVNEILAEARGWSVVTLGVAAPIALRSMILESRGGSPGTRLAWLGVLAYLIYTYLEFAVGPPSTVLFLAYIVAFACAIPALVIVALSFDVAELPSAFEGAPRRAVTGTRR